ncbi:hypothetical protein SARC_06506 [Sphaeroforma arctica JP610]|uniref:Uncharacterized protein n=1 Tax=Sphaeroforma arctica JP610 TaxID=667725 RepID=A0A0L0FWZ4_9EUKA|nr:hypothetical protein SARC_06506 [Sphaeroforma arctica JP610]KNC81154.1 hypothetical protein SARC_06506 [Sphaeroforma arctica JP610]|eukprot:XP_014155056.1 hypothetical protein SARC_06506 [Sphaeroforma arctica JP610]
MIYADVAWTGTSSAFLILACFVKAKFLDDRSVLFRAVTMVIPVAMVFGGVYLRQEGFGWVDEAEYIGTTIVAAAVAVWLLILTPDSGSQNTSEVLYLALVLLGGVIFPGGLALDRYMCDYFGTPYGNMLLPAFWGCGIAFVGLYLYSKSVVERQSVAEQVNGRKKRM